MNVTVIDGGSGARMPDAAVIALSTRSGVRVDGLTDMNGQTTLSEESLFHPLNVTAAKEGFEATTIEDIMVENVTIILFPNGGEGGPPEPIPLPTLAGTVTGLDELPKAIDDSSVNVIVVETSHTSPFNRTRLPDPGPGGLLYEDGPFTIMARPGELAVIATAGTIQRSAIANYQAGAIDYWTMRRSLRPIAMGMRRFVSASPGEAIMNIDVTLDHPLDLVIPVDLDNPPRNIDTGPQRYAVLPRLNLGPEGFWELDTQAEALDATLALNQMPRLDGWDQDITYYLIGFAYSRTANNLPYSVSIEETRNVRGGLFIGPFVGTTQVQAPASGGVLDTGGQVVWSVHDGIESPDRPITPPSANLILIEEPAFGPPKPLWRYVTPSDVTEFVFPALPEAAGEAGLGQGPMYLTIMPFIIEGENFDFEDFTYDALNMGRWKAWSMNTTRFVRGQSNEPPAGDDDQ
ncbi:MAG: carboxypeptidase-like regulatory domain-containing protein [Myxococcota bacterium]|nr:carboxypeptidase-like regulatory domain-containing protein [Myxococcota bacterium]